MKSIATYPASGTAATKAFVSVVRLESKSDASLSYHSERQKRDTPYIRLQV
jgi:hypothetical protein